MEIKTNLKQKIKKNKGFFIVLVLFIIVAALDFWSTLSGGWELANVLEANPITPFIGIIGIMFINVLYVLGITWWYTTSGKPSTRFSLISVLFIITVIRVFVVIANFQTTQSGITVEEAKVIATEVVKQRAMLYLALQLIFPILLSWGSFFFYSLDHHILTKE